MHVYLYLFLLSVRIVYFILRLGDHMKTIVLTYVHVVAYHSALINILIVVVFT